MKFSQLFLFGIRNLKRNRMRVFLTVLGVTIGTASIVAMMSMGIGMEKSFEESINQNRSITAVYVNAGFDSYTQTDVLITRDVVYKFADLSQVIAASPVYNVSFPATSEHYVGNIDVMAVNMEVIKALNLPILIGRAFEFGDRFSLLIGKSVNELFYVPGIIPSSDENRVSIDFYESPLFVYYDAEAYRKAIQDNVNMPTPHLVDVSGIIGSADETLKSSLDYMCYADIDALETLFLEQFPDGKWPGISVDAMGNPYIPTVYSQAVVVVDKVENVSGVQKLINEMGYYAYSDLDQLNRMQDYSKSIQLLLAGIGSITLFVAAIGIANTMLMSILERKKEIGIFKVLGCSTQNVKVIFLLEAGVIGLFGGVVGTIMSIAFSMIINALQNKIISYIPIWLVVVAVIFSLFIGLIAGLLPASKATKLSILQAIKD